MDGLSISSKHTLEIISNPECFSIVLSFCSFSLSLFRRNWVARLKGLQQCLVISFSVFYFYKVNCIWSLSFIIIRVWSSGFSAFSRYRCIQRIICRRKLNSCQHHIFRWLLPTHRPVYVSTFGKTIHFWTKKKKKTKHLFKSVRNACIDKLL